MAKLGPLIVANFILPAMVVDLAGFAYPRMVRSYIACLLVGVIASATKGVTGILLDYLMGMDPDVVVRHVFIATIASAIFGALGAFMVPPVIRRLQANDLIPSSER
jgi:hypothetical protein